MKTLNVVAQDRAVVVAAIETSTSSERMQQIVVHASRWVLLA